jgi:hypothetical protein
LDDIKFFGSLFFWGILGYGFIYTIVFFVARFGILIDEPSIKAGLAGDCAIATSLIICAIAYIQKEK